jgi:hypothetical protein
MNAKAGPVPAFLFCMDCYAPRRQHPAKRLELWISALGNDINAGVPSFLSSMLKFSVRPI